MKVECRAISLLIFQHKNINGPKKVHNAHRPSSDLIPGDYIQLHTSNTVLHIPLLLGELYSVQDLHSRQTWLVNCHC